MSNLDLYIYIFDLIYQERLCMIILFIMSHSLEVNIVFSSSLVVKSIHLAANKSNNL